MWAIGGRLPALVLRGALRRRPAGSLGEPAGSGSLRPSAAARPYFLGASPPASSPRQGRPAPPRPSSWGRVRLAGGKKRPRSLDGQEVPERREESWWLRSGRAQRQVAALLSECGPGTGSRALAERSARPALCSACWGPDGWTSPLSSPPALPWNNSLAGSLCPAQFPSSGFWGRVRGRRRLPCCECAARKRAREGAHPGQLQAPGARVCIPKGRLALQTASVSQPSGEMLRSQDNGTHMPGEVIRWVDVYNRSFCQPKETMVPVSAEHPGEVEHILVPSCVPLRRCAGCCADEELECVPVQMHVVVMEVMKTRFPRSHLGQMPFVEHSACECRPKKLSKDQTKRPPCLPCRDRRRHLDPQTCECRCRRRPQRCRARGLELNEHSCRCEKLRR